MSQFVDTSMSVMGPILLLITGCVLSIMPLELMTNSMEGSVREAEPPIICLSYTA